MRIAFIILLFVLLPKSKDATAAPENPEIPDKHSIKYLRSFNEALWDELGLNELQRENGESTSLEPEKDFTETLKLIIRCVAASRETFGQAVTIRQESSTRSRCSDFLNSLTHCLCRWYVYGRVYYRHPSSLSISEIGGRSAIPVYWLQYPEIVNYLLCSHSVSINDVSFLAQLHCFDGITLPDNMTWEKVTFDDFSFRNSLVRNNKFDGCYFNNTDFRGAELRRCIFKNCEFENITVDENTRFQTSSISACSKQTRDYLADLAGTPEAQKGFILQVLTLTFIQQALLESPAEIAESIEFVTKDYIQQFCVSYPELAEEHPEWINVVLQVLYAITLYKDMEVVDDLRNLMLVHSASSLRVMEKLPKDKDHWMKLMSSISWTSTAFTSTQLLYRHHLRTLLAENNIVPHDVLHDDNCLYHVLVANRLGKNITEIRNTMALFLTAYIQYRYRGTQSFQEPKALLTPDGYEEYRERFNILDQFFDADPNSHITISMAQELLGDLNTANRWLDASTLPFIAIIFRRPVLQITPYGTSVSIVYIDDNGVTTPEWRESVERSGEGSPPIVVIHDGVNHWLTATIMAAFYSFQINEACAGSNQ